MVLLLSDLPESILEEVFEYVYAANFTSHARQRQGAALALSCRPFLQPARRLLYRHVQLEHAGARRKVHEFKGTVERCPYLAGLVRSLKVSTALYDARRSVHDRDSQELAELLRVILNSCERLDEIRFLPDPLAKHHDELYRSAWSAGKLKAFTLEIAEFRDLALLPFYNLESLNIVLALDGDLQWDYDIFFPSWPPFRLRALQVTLKGFTFPAYSDQVMLGKLAQLCRALEAPETLSIEHCDLSLDAFSALLEWSAPKVRDVRLVRSTIRDEHGTRLAGLETFPLDLHGTTAPFIHEIAA